MARILVVGGGCRGRELAGWLSGEGHAVRITTRRAEKREAIERAGAECWPGTPERLATLRGALDGVAIACWLLAGAEGSEEELAELHTRRLEFFLTQMIDTTVRGFVYEASGSAPHGVLVEGERIVRALGERNAIPVEFLRADPADAARWLLDVRAAIESLLARR